MRRPHRIPISYDLVQFGVPRSGLGEALAAGFARLGTLKGVKNKDGVEGGGGCAAYGKLIETLRRLADSLDEVRSVIKSFIARLSFAASDESHRPLWTLRPEQAIKYSFACPSIARHNMYIIQFYNMTRRT